MIQQAEQALKRGDRSPRTILKWAIPLFIILFLLVGYIGIQQRDGLVYGLFPPDPTATPTITPTPVNILSPAEAEQCLRDMAIWVTHDQDDSFFLEGEAEEALSLLSQQTMLDTVIELQPHCQEIEALLCLRWESTFGKINTTNCTQSALYTPPVEGSDFVTLNADISKQYPESDYDWDLVVPIIIRE